MEAKVKKQNEKNKEDQTFQGHTANSAELAFQAVLFDSRANALNTLPRTQVFSHLPILLRRRTRHGSSRMIYLTAGAKAAAARRSGCLWISR